MIEKIIEMFKEKRDNASLECATWKRGNAYERADVRRCAFIDAIEIVREVAKEYGNGWIPCSERLPSKEDCGNFMKAWFQATIPQHDGNATVVMQYEYTTIRGKETARWLWYGRIASVEPIAWKPLDAPYQKGE